MFYTDRQLEIMEFIQRYRKMRGVSPTLEEIAGQFGVSKVTIHDHIRQLEKKAAIRKVPHLARSLEVIDPSFSQPISPEGDRGVTLEVRGRIAAGVAIEAVEHVESIDLSEMLPQPGGQTQIGNPGERYALQVRGDSMVEDGIHDGDYVILERRSVADDGEMVVAIIDDNRATLKRFFRERQTGKLSYRLQPANQNMKPIYTDKVEVRGVVVGVIRRYPAWRAKSS